MDAREVIYGAVSNYCIHTGHPTINDTCDDCDRITDEVVAALAANQLAVVKIIKAEPRPFVIEDDSPSPISTGDRR